MNEGTVDHDCSSSYMCSYLLFQDTSDGFSDFTFHHHHFPPAGTVLKGATGNGDILGDRVWDREW